MKKGMCTTISFLTAVCLLISPVAAATAPQALDISADGTYYLDDGSYIITETTVLPAADGLSRAVSTVSRSKTSTYYNSDNEPMCALKITGTFSVNNGVSVQCTKATANTYVYNDSWSVTDVTTSRTSAAASTASATAKGNFVKKILFITTNTVPVTVTVTCDKYGNG